RGRHHAAAACSGVRPRLTAIPSATDPSATGPSPRSWNWGWNKTGAKPCKGNHNSKIAEGFWGRVALRSQVMTIPAQRGPAEAAMSLLGLVKRFDTTVAVAGLDLDVPAGSFYGLLGPN